MKFAARTAISKSDPLQMSRAFVALQIFVQASAVCEVVGGGVPKVTNEREAAAVKNVE